MDIRINSIHFDHTEKLAEFIQKKVKKLDKYFDNILVVDVFLKVIKPEAAKNKHTELKLSVPSNEFFAEKEADTFEESIDLCIEAMKKQLLKHKEKIKAK